MNKLFTQLCEMRHLDNGYIHPEYTKLANPSILPDISPAVLRIESAIKNREKVFIYGDYDVDGITASTVMRDALVMAGLPRDNIVVMLPDRFVDGYGMSKRLVSRAKNFGATLVVTVDCGSRNHEIIDDLGSNHIDTIITDHHECGDTLPKALAVINPKRPDFAGLSTLRDLAGVGVAFKLVEAMVKAHLIPAGQEKWLLDLVLLGTICDSMPLTLENRTLTYYGAKVLSKTRRPGLIALMRSAGVKNVTAEAIGFQLGPRLNSAGRLASADIALNLLCTRSAAKAASLAAELEELNSKRRSEQRAAFQEISDRGVSNGPVIVEAGKWHEGILGIVAGRLVEEYHRPAIVLSEMADGTFKGSGRSFGDFNLADALKSLSEIATGGGHAAAAGVRLDKGNLAPFREGINTYYNSLHLADQERFLVSQPDFTTDSLADFNLDLLESLNALEPFGPGNEEPLFCLTGAEISAKHRMGSDKNHLRLDLCAHDGHTIKAVAFYAKDRWFELAESDARCRFCIRPTLNEWQGARSVEARLVDIIPEI